METVTLLLRKCEALLRKVGETFWANKINNVLQKDVETLDLYQIEEIISWYGGMGSFNDLLISEHNDHLVSGEDEDKLNDELNSIRSAIYREAMYLRNW